MSSSASLLCCSVSYNTVSSKHIYVALLGSWALSLGENIAAAAKALHPCDAASRQDRKACLQAAGAPFDIIVGTDVVFAKRLVEPLLQTIHSLSKKDTVVWLCLQVIGGGWYLPLYRQPGASDFAMLFSGIPI
jgi:hypothetical protein